MRPINKNYVISKTNHILKLISSWRKSVKKVVFTIRITNEVDRNYVKENEPHLEGDG